MQTFLPYPDFERSARALDPKRLGKQRVEVIQIVRALTVPGYGWANHPAVLMWKGHEEALGRYGLTCCAVWTDLGFDDTCATTIRSDLAQAGVIGIRSQAELAEVGALPEWLGNEDFHRGHRSSLLGKDPGRYRAQFPDTPEGAPYVWPVRSASVLEAERKKAENAVRRTERERDRKEAEAARARRRRSRSAKQGWATRRRNGR